jgi:chromosome partitioning protein
MTGLSVALANLKPGTGKTTSAVWLAHVFARAGNSVLLVDADPSGSALEWSDLAAMDPRLATPEAAFPFRIVALPSRELHRRLPDIARDDDVVIIDAPQIEDHGAIARSAMRYADEILIPCAPSPIEINRTTPVRDEIADVQAVRDRPIRSAVLLNRCITRAHSVSDARQALQNLDYDVLATTVPRLEVYAQSFGMPIADTGRDVWRQVARDLIDRCARPGLVWSLLAVHRPAQHRWDHLALSSWPGGQAPGPGRRRRPLPEGMNTPVLTAYLRDPDGVYRAHSVCVLTIATSRIARVTAFTTRACSRPLACRRPPRCSHTGPVISSARAIRTARTVPPGRR